MKYSLLKEVIDRLDEFEQQPGGAKPTLPAFAQWLLAQTSTASTLVEDNPAHTPQQRWNAQVTAVEKDISMFLVYLNRYARQYTRKALEGSPLTTAEDFSYLAGLMQTESLTKTELILMNKQEKTSGMEVIKRLLAAGLIEQFNHEQDRRSKRLRITPYGRQTIFSIFEPMLKVSHLVAGNLTASEKLTLVEILRKLNHFHEPIFREHRDAGLAELVQLAQEKLTAS